MMICKQCKSTKIRSRSNFSHGKKSKSKTTLSCKECGSSDIEVSNPNKRRRNNRR